MRRKRKRLTPPAAVCSGILAILTSRYPLTVASDWDLTLYPNTIDATSILFDLELSQGKPHIAVAIEKGISDSRYRRVESVIGQFGRTRAEPVVILKNAPHFDKRAGTAHAN